MPYSAGPISAFLITLMLYNSPMTWFSQNDPRWANEILGFNPPGSVFTIGQYGCVVAAEANLQKAATGNAQISPDFVNSWGKANGAFVPGTGVWIWSAGLGLGGVTAKGTTSDVNAVNNFLQADPNFAIIEVVANGRQHFCLAPYVNTIADSWDGVQKPMSTYQFVNSHLYTAINMPAPVTPPPPVTSGPLNATVTIRVPLLNARTEPNTTSPVAAVFHAGTAHTLGWTVGQNVTIAGKTDNVWLKSEAGHWFAQAGTNSNFGHAPAKLTAAQSLHLVTSTTAGSVMKAFKIRNSKK